LSKVEVIVIMLRKDKILQAFYIINDNRIDEKWLVYEYNKNFLKYLEHSGIMIMVELLMCGGWNNFLW